MRVVLFITSICLCNVGGIFPTKKKPDTCDDDWKILGSNVTCSLDPTQVYIPSCSTWTIISATVFSQTANITTHLKNVQNYLNRAGSQCTNSTYLKLVSDKMQECKDYSEPWGNPSTELLNRLVANPKESVPRPGSEDQAIGEAMWNVGPCADENPLYAPAVTGIVYLFTDYNCSQLSGSELQKVVVIASKLLHDGYSFRILLSNAEKIDDDCLDMLSCLNCNTYQCQIALITEIPLTNCRLAPTTTTPPVSTSLSSKPPVPTTLSSKPPVNTKLSTLSIGSSTTIFPQSSKTFTTLELVFIIGIPVVLFCAICACCINNWKNIQRVVWKRKINKIQPGTLSHYNSGGRNEYMDIHKLAAMNKKDYWELPPKNLFIHENEILGTGAFSNVFKGTLSGKVPLLKAQSGLLLNIESQKDGSCETAVKRLPAHADEQNRMDFFHEIDFMKRLGYHVHIIAMLGCISDPWDPLILVEYCHHGDMLNFLRKRRSFLLTGIEEDGRADGDICLRIKDLVSFSWQISDGLSYLSSKNFIHRDIAARNVLLTRNLVAKVSDFGLCRYIDSALYTTKGGRLPIKWMSIESLKFFEYSVKSDVWAFGVCLFEIFSMGVGPYQSIQPIDMLQYLEDGNRLERPAKCPHEIYDLMVRCWNGDADLRPTFNEIRGELTTMLNLDDEQYGYLSVTPDHVPQKSPTQVLQPELDSSKRPSAPPMNEISAKFESQSQVNNARKEDVVEYTGQNPNGKQFTTTPAPNFARQQQNMQTPMQNNPQFASNQSSCYQQTNAGTATSSSRHHSPFLRSPAQVNRK